MTTYSRLLLLLATPLLVACSIPDPSSAELAHIHEMIGTPGSQRFTAMQRWTSRQNALRWLLKKPPNQKVVGVVCREKQAGKWGEWKEAYDHVDDDPVNSLETLVDFFVDVIADGMTYMEAAQDAENAAAEFAKDKAKKTGLDTQCKPSWSPGFAPDELPENITDPSTQDIVENVLRFGPASGKFAPMPGGFAPLPGVAPMPLCPLGDGLPCPSDPRYPPGQTPQPPGGGG